MTKTPKQQQEQEQKQKQQNAEENKVMIRSRSRSLGNQHIPQSNAEAEICVEKATVNKISRSSGSSSIPRKRRSKGLRRGGSFAKKIKPAENALHADTQKQSEPVSDDAEATKEEDAETKEKAAVVKSSSSSCSNNNSNSSSRVAWEDLPYPVVHEIWSRVNAFMDRKMRCFHPNVSLVLSNHVFKKWRDLQIARESRQPGGIPVKWLLVPDLHWAHLISCFDGRICSLKPPTHRDVIIADSHGGLFLQVMKPYMRRHWILHIYNPITNESRALPELVPPPAFAWGSKRIDLRRFVSRQNDGSWALRTELSCSMWGKIRVKPTTRAEETEAAAAVAGGRITTTTTTAVGEFKYKAWLVLKFNNLLVTYLYDSEQGSWGLPEVYEDTERQVSAANSQFFVVGNPEFLVSIDLTLPQHVGCTFLNCKGHLYAVKWGDTGTGTGTAAGGGHLTVSRMIPLTQEDLRNKNNNNNDNVVKWFNLNNINWQPVWQVPPWNSIPFRVESRSRSAVGFAVEEEFCRLWMCRYDRKRKNTTTLQWFDLNNGGTYVPFHINNATLQLPSYRYLGLPGNKSHRDPYYRINMYFLPFRFSVTP